MQGIWRSPEGGERSSKLLKAPLFDGIAAFVYAAHKLWHPYGTENAKTLWDACYSLTLKARDRRKEGHSALCPKEDNSNAHTLLDRGAYRYRYDKRVYADRKGSDMLQDWHAADICLRIAIGMIESAIPEIEREQQNHAFLSADRECLQGLWEKLNGIMLQNPYKHLYLGPLPNEAKIIHQAEVFALCRECQGLAHTMIAVTEHSRYIPIGPGNRESLIQEIGLTYGRKRDVEFKEFLERGAKTDWQRVRETYFRKAQLAMEQICKFTQQGEYIRKCITTSALRGEPWQDDRPQPASASDAFIASTVITCLVERHGIDAHRNQDSEM